MISSMETATNQPAESVDPSTAAVTRIAVGVDGFPEGNDAVVLGMALARVTGAQLMLVAVHSVPLVVAPAGLNWTSLRKEARATLHKAREAWAPGARVVVETDLSVPRALHRVVHRERRDLLVMGSSRHAPAGKVRIGKRTRQLLGRFECPLAVAPRGFHTRSDPGFARIGVGYDGGPESEAALELAGSIAAGAGAEMQMCGVVDDRFPPLSRSGLSKDGDDAARWEEAVMADMERLRAEADEATQRSVPAVRVEVRRGRPADALLELSEQVDLLVIGSRRWGPMTRLLLGSTGEALLHDASCPVLVVPRPSS
jgi:nucleotide-binding universal stress UspA family protein